MTWLCHGAVALIGFLVLTGLAVNGFSLFAARRHFSQKKIPGLPGSAPKVSILKPVEGGGPHTYEALASFCRLDYSGAVEILIGTINADDPVVVLAIRLQNEFPNRDIRLVLAAQIGVNRKTSIMESLWRGATGQFLFFSDADVFAPADYLKRLVPLLAQPGAGCLTCLPRGIKAETLGGKMIALHYSFNYLPQWMLAQRTTGIHWAVGHTMAVPRAVLEQLDGFKKFPDHLADDYELGNRISRLGLRVIVPPLQLDCMMPAESFTAAFTRMQRWKRTIRRSRGAQFAGVIITCPVFWALLLAVIQPFAWWSWGAFGLAVAGRWLLAANLQQIVKMPDWPRIWWLLPAVDVVEAMTFFGTYFGNSIFWAGRHYLLLEDGTLELADTQTQPQPKFTGSMSTASETSSGKAID